MIPACSHTGTPRHFHSSTTSGSACLTRLRTRASVSPRQSPSSSILASISWEGESPPVPSFEPLFAFAIVGRFLSLTRQLSILADGLGPRPLARVRDGSRAALKGCEERTPSVDGLRTVRRRRARIDPGRDARGAL